jgi:hypothetical protein
VAGEGAVMDKVNLGIRAGNLAGDLRQIWTGAFVCDRVERPRGHRRRNPCPGPGAGRVDAGGAVRKRDVLVKRQRTIVLFTPVTDDAREWFAANVVSELWQWRGPTLAADLRPACDLLDGIRRRRLRIQVVV